MSQPQFDFGPSDDGADDLQPEGTYTVSELAGAINRRLRAGFNEGIWVRGEIQGWSQRGPHAYFTLVDDQADDRAVLNVALFAPQRQRLQPLLRKHRLELSDGMKVRIHGFLDFYAGNGRLSLKMGGIDPRFTLGDLAAQRQQVLRQLAARGLIDANSRNRLTMIPLRIGVVTSVGSAAWHDFEHELAGSGVGFELAVCDVRVQGDTAVRRVAAAIRQLGRRPLDAIVVIRGGGARNELAVFDAAEIAEAIASVPLPVLTGIGHEVDRSIADEVAHTAFKTPTACAAALVGAAYEFRRRSDAAAAAIHTAVDGHLATAERRLIDRAQRIARRTHAAVASADVALAAHGRRLGRAASASLDRVDHQLDRAVQRLCQRPPQLIAAEQRHLEAMVSRVRAADPRQLVARGWTITRRSDGTIVRGIDDVAAGESLVTVVADGTITSTVVAADATTTDDPTTGDGA